MKDKSTDLQWLSSYLSCSTILYNLMSSCLPFHIASRLNVGLWRAFWLWLGALGTSLSVRFNLYFPKSTSVSDGDVNQAALP
jgi:hypothetical protein